MQFGGQRGVIEEKRVKDLSKATPLKNRFGGQRDTDALKEKEEKRKARFTRRDKDVAQECPDCEGFGYHFNNDSQLGEMCSNCIQGWVIKDSDDVISTLTDETFERGVKLGAGVAVGFSLISLGIGVAAGVLGLIYERVTGE
tara:strand:- start:43 stop:468 length:426 start_codon:yes stop_codon:yes gene_type:complete